MVAHRRLGLSGLVAQAKRASQRRNQRLSTGHVLLVMLQQGGEAGRLLSERGVQEGALLSALKVVDEEPANALDIALERAQRWATRAQSPAPTAVHLLLVVARDHRSAAHQCLEQLGVGARSVWERAIAMLQTTAPGKLDGAEQHRTRARESGQPPRFTRVARGTDAPAARSPLPPRPPRVKAPDAVARPPAHPSPCGPAAVERSAARGELTPNEFPILSSGRDLTSEAAGGRLDPVLGREEEINQLLDVLGRRRANNPLLVAPPGVGKTALVEGLALRLCELDRPGRGAPPRVLIELPASTLVAGTGVRGALADRLSRLRAEIAQLDHRVILFIDEIHVVFGAGEGPDDLANELKRSLSRDDMTCIGATTEHEYHKYFERDPALARRFCPIFLNEPNDEVALEILRGIAPQYEEHHGVRYCAEALRGAVELSRRFIPDRHLPDKAVSIIDLAAARLRRRGGREVVELHDVAEVVGEQARIPTAHLLQKDGQRMLELESVVSERVVGHEEAIGRIAAVLRKSAVGFRSERPLGVFLLLGPTGVGKTETAKAVADAMFPDRAMTRLDMSDFSEAHAVARLFGAPPGYVGHESGGQLTEAVRRRPHQLLLFDEIEKAHPEVWLSLLPVLEEGRVTDGRGREVSFCHTVIFMTSNLGATAQQARSRIGFDATSASSSVASEGAVAHARGALPAELWNRIDEPLYFGPLSRDEVRQIARRLLDGVKSSVAEQGVELRYEPEVVELLMDQGGMDAALGARPMRRTIGRCVEARLANAILQGSIAPGDVAELTVSPDREICVVKRGARAKAG